MNVKKRYVLHLTIVTIVLFIVYQLFLFYSITNDDNKPKIEPNLLELSKYHHKTKEDAFINSNGALRGVNLNQMKNYRPDSNNMFKCLKSDQLIPYDQVNDDYCDCTDHSDEPSTNACTEGVFYCDTQFIIRTRPQGQFIPSSRVNDGICDCCDGSDEWIPVVLDIAIKKCSNFCHSQDIKKRTRN